ncbi:hypothetical protein [uncultured Brachyspira sp.]|uniref:hypothetical protein n=1 Tax=uncultured Brachyspira sp. TaxID=221953 RepID=UPI0026059FEF|nr:hypothetical protein [uncultured Brachyspira sp.]
MKKQIIFTLFLLIFIFSCSKTPTDPNTNNNTAHSQSFTGNFSFGTFGNASALSINEDGSIYMNIENGLLTIKKEMVTKKSDSQYTIKGQMPTIKYDNTSSATTKSLMFSQSASDMNTVDVSLNLSGGSLSLSGQINDNSVSGNLKEVSGYIPSDYTGTYYIGNGQNGNEIQITSDGYVINKGYEGGNVILEEEYTDKLIKISENEYILNHNSAKRNIPSTGTISFGEAESIVITEAMKYYNISQKDTLKFENNTLTITGQGLTSTYKDVDTIGKYIEEVAKDRSYTNKIDYSLFTLQLGEESSQTINKK